MIGRASLCGIAATALALTLVASSAGSSAEFCAIPNTDLAAALGELSGGAVVSTTRTDVRSDEPVLRQIADFPTGTTLVVEQQNCEIYNLRATLLSPNERPVEAELKLLGQALALSPLFRSHFGELDPGADLARELASSRFAQSAEAGSQVTYGWDALPPVDEQSEAVISFMSSGSDVAPYRSVLTVYVSAGE